MTTIGVLRIWRTKSSALATARGDEVASKIAELISTADSRTHEYDCIVATQDWHIDPGAHFSEKPDFVDSWPVHCVADTYGAEIRGPVRRDLIDQFFKKGEYSAAYSGFEGVNADNTRLADWLREHTDGHGADVVLCGAGVGRGAGRRQRGEHVRARVRVRDREEVQGVEPRRGPAHELLREREPVRHQRRPGRRAHGATASPRVPVRMPSPRRAIAAQSGHTTSSPVSV